MRNLLLAAPVLGAAYLVLVASAVGASSSIPVNQRPPAILSADDHALLDEIERASFLFFREQTHPETGLVRDRARADGTPNEGMASVAASGFGLAAWAIAVERGWVERTEAVQTVRRMLRFLAEKAPREHGFYYHFMAMDTGERFRNCELSSVDTSLLLAGAIVAREYFRDPEIAALVNRIYADVDWRWFLNGGETLSMGWRPERGFSRYRWKSYTEHMVVSLLALGSPTHALDATHWRAWVRDPAGSYAGYRYLQKPPLFIHQFSHAFVDFRGMRDAYADYFKNSVFATLAQRQFCLDIRHEFPSWSEKLWGITASDSERGYQAWGGPPRTIEGNALDGTVVPCASAGSLPFAPAETLIVLRHMRRDWGERGVWQRYGFVDAFNPETGWINPDVLGIDVGITLLQAENVRTGIIWSLFMQAPEVQQALQQAGFVSIERELASPARAQVRALAEDAWRTLRPAPVAAATAGLQLTAGLAARSLGLWGDDALLAWTREALATLATPENAALESEGRAAREPQEREVAPTRYTAPTDPTELAQYAAGLTAIRQALPALAPEATRRLKAIDWNAVKPGSSELGAGSRLAVFFQVASGTRTPAAWSALTRTPEEIGPVFVLAPSRIEDQLLPGLWLDEREIITGASASQLAYALVRPVGGAAASGTPLDPLGAALLLEHFPVEALARLQATPPARDWLERAPVAHRAALLVAATDALEPNVMKGWIQSDPLVQAGRRAIPDFAVAAFGKTNALVRRYELAGPVNVPPERVATVRAASLPREQWDWQHVAGREFREVRDYREMVADVHPSDPVVEFRFAFTYDQQALRFHAEVHDAPEGFELLPNRRRQVELYLDPQNDGLDWFDPADFYFIYKTNGQKREWFHDQPAEANITPTERGYTLEAVIPWSVLALQPAPGLQLSASPTMAAAGPKESHPVAKLNWRYFQRIDERFELGTLRLE